MFGPDTLPVWAFLVSALAFGISGLTFYLTRLQRPRIVLALRKRLDPVFSTDRDCRKAHLIISFVNSGARAGVIEETIFLDMTFPDGSTGRFTPKLYFRFLSSSRRDDLSPAVPIAIPANSSVLERIEFECDRPIIWRTGDYKLTVTARELRGRRSRARARFSLSEEKTLEFAAAALAAQKSREPKIVEVTLVAVPWSYRQVSEDWFRDLFRLNRSTDS